MAELGPICAAERVTLKVPLAVLERASGQRFPVVGGMVPRLDTHAVTAGESGVSNVGELHGGRCRAGQIEATLDGFAAIDALLKVQAAGGSGIDLDVASRRTVGVIAFGPVACEGEGAVVVRVRLATEVVCKGAGCRLPAPPVSVSLPSPPFRVSAPSRH